MCKMITSNFVIFICAQAVIYQVKSQCLPAPTEVCTNSSASPPSQNEEPSKCSIDPQADPLGLLKTLIRLANQLVAKKEQSQLTQNIPSNKIADEASNGQQLIPIPNQVLLQNRVLLPPAFTKNIEKPAKAKQNIVIENFARKNFCPNQVQKSANPIPICNRNQPRVFNISTGIIQGNQVNRIPVNIQGNIQVSRHNLPSRCQNSQINVNAANDNCNKRIPLNFITNNIPKVSVPPHNNQARLLPKVTNNIVQPYQIEAPNNVNKLENLPGVNVLSNEANYPKLAFDKTTQCPQNFVQQLPQHLPIVNIPQPIISYVQRNKKQPTIISMTPDINPFVSGFKNTPLFPSVNVPPSSLKPPANIIIEPRQSLPTSSPCKNLNLNSFGPTKTRPYSMNNQKKQPTNPSVVPNSLAPKYSTFLPTNSLIIPGYNPYVLPAHPSPSCPCVSSKLPYQKQRSVLIPPPCLL